MNDNHTIYALATPPGKSGVAVLRISGPDTLSAMQQLGIPKLAPRVATISTLIDPKSGQPLDKILALYFAGPSSFTGEDTLELHLHGSRAVIQTTLQALSSIAGLRLAEPGEFSRRAFLNGKMDLTEAEGLADLIDAETAMQAKLALRQATGELKKLYENWRHQIIGCMARIEAYIDFPDESLPPELEQEIIRQVQNLKASLEAHLNDNQRGERLREGARIAIIGAPNAGKSSLLNYIARREVAIVSPIAGTTRDALEVHLDIGGYPATFIDTAGLRESRDIIELEGVRRAQIHAKSADFRLILLDGDTYPEIPEYIQPYLKEANDLVAVTKSDLDKKSIGRYFSISSKNGAGVDKLFVEIRRKIEELMEPGDSPTITRERHRKEIQNAQKSIDFFLASGRKPIELRAESLRQAATALGRITGKIDLEEVLDALFSTFCIGK